MQQIIIGSRCVTPSKIICVGRNYLDHINELNNEIPEDMVLFFKPNSAISNTLNASHSTNGVIEDLHFESEICFVYEQQKFSAIGIGLDLTKRDLQSKLKAKGLPWERAKAFNGAAVFSDFVEIDKLNDKLNDQVQLTLHIDNQLTQHALTLKMIYSPAQILAEIQTFITLEDGDIIMTGTPKGVGKVKANSRFICELKQADQVLMTKEWLAQ